MFFGAIYPVDFTLTNAKPAPVGVPASIDFETRSTVDLKSAGARRYAQHPDTRILCLAIKIGPAEAIWVPGMDMPPLLADAIERGEKIAAWNATFEIAIWQEICVKRHGWPDLPVDRFTCTMQKAALVGCPGALERAAAAIRAPVAKDMDGHRLMLKMCKPLPNRKGETAVRWHDDPLDHLRTQRYCMDDVRAEIAVGGLLPLVPPMEVAVMRVDRHINVRGIRVDRAAAEGAAKIAREEKARLNAEMQRITNGAIKSTNQVAVILEFIQRRGIQLEALRASDVRDVLNDIDESGTSGDLDVTDEQIAAYQMTHGGEDTAVQVLRLRAEASKASTAKLDALVKGASAGDLMTDLFAYSGAYRTQRWAGRRFQAHNLPRANPPCHTEDETERWYETLASGRYDDFRDLLPTGKNGTRMTVMDGLKASLRGFLMASTTLHRLVVADLGQIEARGAAWVAGQWDLIEAFERLDAAVARGADEDEIKSLDIYTVNGRKMAVDRQGGKIATLACFAADTQVLVLRNGTPAVIPIVAVRATDLTWDGVEWVAHKGVVSKGTQRCMELSGTNLTPDHQIWCGPSRGWMPAAEVGLCANTRSLALGTAADSLSSLGISWAQAAALKGSPCSATAVRPSTGSTTTTSWRGALRAATRALKLRAQAHVEKHIYIMRSRARIWSIAAAFSIAWLQYEPAAPTPAVKRGPATGGAVSGAGGLTNTGMNASDPLTGAAFNRHCGGGLKCWPTSSPYRDGIARILSWIGLTTMAAMHREICNSPRDKSTHPTSAKSTLCPRGSSNSKPKLPVYDIAYSGPRNRFTIITEDGPLIVHNCGYGGGWNALMIFAAAYGLVLTEVEARNMVDAYRSANPMIVMAWAVEERCAVAAMESPGTVIPVGDGRSGAYCYRDGNLMRRLPSGRCLIYRRMRREPQPTPWGQMRLTLTYEGNIFAKGQPGTFVRLKTYGGKLFQNCVQAICRDILAAGLIRAERAGLKAVLHVHDEQGVDSRLSDVAEHSEILVNSMVDRIDWVPGLPIASSADVSLRYRKN